MACLQNAIVTCILPSSEHHAEDPFSKIGNLQGNPLGSTMNEASTARFVQILEGKCVRSFQISLKSCRIFDSDNF